MPREQLATMIVLARKRAGYETRYQFASAAGIAHSTLGYIETGKVSPSVETLEKIMNAIDWEVDVKFRPKKKRVLLK